MLSLMLDNVDNQYLIIVKFIAIDLINSIICF
ncbi:hypothetical protein C8E01_107115 [Pontibacter virosus]|uniref:Uncharacterized protein n=1 Tax=Pontibacter virosus TaxID=1765052 RepID=A0A2U1AVM9_9BACT|nr:hypothetical protein C8E01_107115 [Pontibacter virosus]